jgi:hypothetical protein
MSRRDAIDLGLAAVSLAALIARVIAMAMSDLDQGLRDFRCEISTVPEWMNAEADL